MARRSSHGPMLIRAYGLFWQRDEVAWAPGRGAARHLYGRRGTRNPGLRVADFKDQIGLYILYGLHGPYYVGLTRGRQGFASRIGNHDNDEHSRYWDRFSWFGFRDVLDDWDEHGIQWLAPRSESTKLGTTSQVIADIEALTIKALGCHANKNKMKFGKADEWIQVPKDDPGGFLDKVRAQA